MPGADQVVQFEGTEHHFPADFTDADIAKALANPNGPTQPPIGIRPASPWESIKSRFSEFTADPLGTLLSPIPGSEDFQGHGDPWGQFALGGIAPGGATLHEFMALPKSKGLARLTDLPGKLIQAYRNASAASRAASAARVAQTAGQEMVRSGELPSLEDIRNLPVPPARTPPEIPGLEDWKAFKPTRGAVPKFTPGPEVPEIGVSGRRGARAPDLGEGALVPPASVPDLSGLPEPAATPFKPNPRVAKTMRYSSGSEVPEIGVTGRRAPMPDLGTGPLVPPATEPDLSGLPVPGPTFKPNPHVAKGMKFSPGSEIPEVGVSGRNPGLVRRTPFTPASAPAVDITTGEELVPAPKGKGPKSAPIPPIEPKGSPVPPNSPSFRHPADYTDLIRQFHATHPKGTSLRSDAAAVYNLKPGTMPTYEQALAIHEWRLRNPGKSPTAADIK